MTKGEVYLVVLSNLLFIGSSVKCVDTYHAMHIALM